MGLAKYGSKKLFDAETSTGDTNSSAEVFTGRENLEFSYFLNEAITTNNVTVKIQYKAGDKWIDLKTWTLSSSSATTDHFREANKDRGYTEFRARLEGHDADGSGGDIEITVVVNWRLSGE